jgi:hypothetical protein
LGHVPIRATAHLARLEAITVDDLKVEAPFVALSQETKILAGDDTQGLLGAEVFRRYRMTWNLPAKRVLCGETAETRSPYEFDMSGMFVVTAGDDFHAFRVLSALALGHDAKQNTVVRTIDFIKTPPGKGAQNENETANGLLGDIVDIPEAPTPSVALGRQESCLSEFDQRGDQFVPVYSFAGPIKELI